MNRYLIDILAAILCLICIGLAISSARSQEELWFVMPCNTKDAMNVVVATKYKEHAAATAMTEVQGQTRPIKLYVNPETGTWTLVLMLEPDKECMAASGDNWQPLLAPPPGNPT